MSRDDRLRYGVCWWCGEPDSLFRLEGARLAGSDPLSIPISIFATADPDTFRVCPRCAVLFGRLRVRAEAEWIEAWPAVGVVSRAEIDQAVDQLTRRESRRVRDALRTIIEERDAEAE